MAARSRSQADGDFTFEPAASTSCTDASDFFDYTVAIRMALVLVRLPVLTRVG